MADERNPNHLRLICIWNCVFVLLHRSVVVVVVAQDPCENDVSFLSVPYQNMTDLTCNSNVWNDFVVRHRVEQDNVVTIIVSTLYMKGWVGMGFSKDGMMDGSSAMVGWIGRHDRPHIKQYYLAGNSPDQVIPDKGELQLTNIPPAVHVQGAQIYLAFQLKFQGPPVQQQILLAYGELVPVNYRLLMHTDKASLNMSFSHEGPDEMVTFAKMLTNHGILGITGWGVLLPVGAIVARYCRHKEPLWYYLHASIQFMGFILGIATVVTALTFPEDQQEEVQPHKNIGLFILALVVLQIMAFFLRPDPETKLRKYWNWYHAWTGRFALLMAALNIVLGIQAVGSDGLWKISYSLILAVTLVAVIVLEVLLRLRTPSKTLPPAFQMSST